MGQHGISEMPARHFENNPFFLNARFHYGAETLS